MKSVITALVIFILIVVMIISSYIYVHSVTKEMLQIVYKSEKDFLKQIDRDIKKSNICEENSIKLIYVINDDIEINNLIPKIYNENNIVQIESFLKEWK